MCRKDKESQKRKPGRYECTKCGTVYKKKKELCHPKKIKK